MKKLRAWWDRQPLQQRLAFVVAGSAIVAGWCGERANQIPLGLFFGLLYIAEDCDRRAGHTNE